MFVNVHVSLYSLSRGSICNFGIKQVYQIRHHDQTCKTVTTFIKSTIKYDKNLYLTDVLYSTVPCFLDLLELLESGRFRILQFLSRGCHLGAHHRIPRKPRHWSRPNRPTPKTMGLAKATTLSRIHGEELRLSENLHGHIRYVAKPQDFTSNHAEIC